MEICTSKFAGENISGGVLGLTGGCGKIDGSGLVLPCRRCGRIDENTPQKS